MERTPITGAGKLFFSTIKESRGTYFVEYKPPNPDYRFATLSVVFPEAIEPSAVPGIMEAEVRDWINRYPVPVMASSFDGSGALQDLSPERDCDHLIGIRERSTGSICLYWEPIPVERIPDDALNPEWLKRVYSKVPWKTQSELAKEANGSAKSIRAGWWMVFGWFAVLPAAWAVVEWAGPQWLATGVMLYSLGKAYLKAMELLGKRKKSPRDLENEDRERRMRHYFYHCERNPEGFMRLKAENLEREERAEIRREAAMLNAKSIDRS
jgi:hypothetical protein